MDLVREQNAEKVPTFAHQVAKGSVRRHGNGQDDFFGTVVHPDVGMKRMGEEPIPLV